MQGEEEAILNLLCLDRTKGNNTSEAQASELQSPSALPVLSRPDIRRPGGRKSISKQVAGIKMPGGRMACSHRVCVQVCS